MIKRLYMLRWKGEGFQPMQLYKVSKTSETAFVELLEKETIALTGFYYRIKKRADLMLLIQDI